MPATADGHVLNTAQPRRTCLLPKPSDGRNRSSSSATGRYTRSTTPANRQHAGAGQRHDMRACVRVCMQACACICSIAARGGSNAAAGHCRLPHPRCCDSAHSLPSARHGRASSAPPSAWGGACAAALPARPRLHNMRSSTAHAHARSACMRACMHSTAHNSCNAARWVLPQWLLTLRELLAHAVALAGAGVCRYILG